MWMCDSIFVKVVEVGKAKNDWCQEDDGSIRCLGKQKEGHRSCSKQYFFCYGTLQNDVSTIYNLSSGLTYSDDIPIWDPTFQCAQSSKSNPIMPLSLSNACLKEGSHKENCS
ncbi:hypothetical protein ACMFMG_008371 [Clarireedia jacksonii]